MPRSFFIPDPGGTPRDPSGGCVPALRRVSPWQVAAGLGSIAGCSQISSGVIGTNNGIEQ